MDAKEIKMPDLMSYLVFHLHLRCHLELAITSQAEKVIANEVCCNYENKTVNKILLPISFLESEIMQVPEK